MTSETQPPLPPPGSNNPYAAPTVDLLSAPQADDGENFSLQGRSTSIGQGINWIARGWNIFTQSPLIWIVNAFIVLAIYMFLSFVPLIGSLVSFLLYGLLSGGLMIGAHRQHSGRALEVGDTFSGFQSPNSSNLFVLGLLYVAAWFGVILVIGILTAVLIGATGIGSAMWSGDSSALVGLLAGASMGLLLIILLALAVSVPIFMAFWFAPSLVAINAVAPMAALKSSFMACLRNFLPFFIYGIILAVLFVIGSLPLFLGLLVVLPLLYTSSYAAYRDIYLADDGS